MKVTGQVQFLVSPDNSKAVVLQVRPHCPYVAPIPLSSLYIYLSLPPSLSLTKAVVLQVCPSQALTTLTSLALALALLALALALTTPPTPPPPHTHPTGRKTLMWGTTHSP